MKANNKPFLVLALFAAILVMTSAARAQSASQPKLWIDAVLHLYGDVVQGEKAVRPFSIKNQGKADLIIERVEPD